MRAASRRRSEGAVGISATALATSSRGRSSGASVRPTLERACDRLPGGAEFRAEGAVVGQYQIAFAIPDAVAAAMVGLHGVVIRSPIVGTRYTGEVLDLARIAREAEVDTILTGTIARAGSRVRVSSQLLEVPGGTLIWSDPLRPLPGFTALSDRAAAKYRDACLAFADAGGQRLFGL